MTRQWRIRITGRPKPEPDRTLLVKAVLALGEELQRAKEQETAAAEPESDVQTEATAHDSA